MCCGARTPERGACLLFKMRTCIKNAQNSSCFRNPIYFDVSSLPLLMKKTQTGGNKIVQQVALRHQKISTSHDLFKGHILEDVTQ